MTSETPGAGQPDPAEQPGPPAGPPPSGAPASGADASPTEVIPRAHGAAPAGTPAAVPPPAQPGQWSAPAQQAAPPPQQPAPPPQQPAGWGPAAPGPAPQQPGWAAAPSGPGGPTPPGTWNPAPASSSGNGCLKGCIIVAVVLVVLVAIGLGALVIFSRQIASDVGVNPDTGEAQECPLVSNDELNAIFGGSTAEARPMGGIFRSTVGQFLDNRVLKDASDCWIVGSGTTTAVTGRIAAVDGVNATGDFEAAKAAAQAGRYYVGDASGYGDEAFCTGISDAASFGILVRSGGRLVYVSLLNPTSGAIGDWQKSADGVTTSPDTCALAGAIANAVLR